LRCLNVLVREVVQLLVNQFVDDLPQLHHTSYTAFGVVGQFDLRHDRIFPVEHLAVHHRVGEVFHVRVGRQGAPGGLLLGNVRGIHLGGGILPLDVLHRFGKLVGKAGTFKGCNGQFLPSVLGAFGGQFAQHHLRVVYEILVDGKAVLGLAKLHPVRLVVDGAVTLLQKDNIADNIRASVGTESVVGQTNGPQQIGSFCHVLAGRRIFTVQRVTTGNKRHHAARTHLVDGLGEKVVVDAEVQLVIRFVVDFVIAKRYVADR